MLPFPFWPVSAKPSGCLPSPSAARTKQIAHARSRKTASLAWTLVKHFKRDLILQAVWAAFASLFLFAPTLLLRVILEYIEHPEDTPKNVAWLFVSLLLLTEIVVAIGNGQALFIGRRICIRLRAIVIGEVYAKALRRKATAGMDKELGASKGDKANPDNSKDDSSQTNAGAIINLMAVDSFKVSEVCAYLHFLVSLSLSLFLVMSALSDNHRRLLPCPSKLQLQSCCSTKSWVGARLPASAS